MSEVDSLEILPSGREVLRQEAAAVAALVDRLGSSFEGAVRAILASRGRVVVTGMGKSGHIAQKTAATLASTGTPALYLHPADAVHGDLGMVTSGDVVIALSYSGETDEILAILPAIKRVSVPLVAVTGNLRSTLATTADFTLDVSVDREACPLDLAPTTSTTAMLAMMDAVAVAAMRERRFTREDYALLHPAGSLGRRLLLRVSDLMRTGDQLALLPTTATVMDALLAISKAQSGSVMGVDEEGCFVGLLSDGDIRRLFLRHNAAALTLGLSETLNRTPRTVRPDRLVSEALVLMEQDPPCGELPVLDDARRPVGVLNLKDMARKGIF